MMRNIARILAQLPCCHWRISPLRGALLAVGGLALTVTVTAFGTAANSLTQSIPQQTHTQDLNVATLSTLSNTGLFVREERIRSGDTLERLLRRLGVNEDDVLNQLRTNRDATPLFTQLAPTKIVAATISETGQLQGLAFPLNSSEQSLVLSRTENGFAVSKTSAPLDLRVEMKSAEIHSSLFGATDSTNIPDAIALQLVDIFGGDIDFHTDLRKGDRFSVAYELFTAQGKTVKTGRILAAEFLNAGKRYRALWFADANNGGGYYTPEGKSFRKAFLRSPLEFSRITSGFSSARFHPVLQTWRAHRGVDYAASVGTRIKATADGIVEYAGTQGGYGRVIILKHQGHYSTLYGHLSAFASEVKLGKHVSQGDIIAFSGASGLASGPHLHYEFRIDGVHQNPLTVALPGALPLSASQMPAFQHTADVEIARLNMLDVGALSVLE